MEGQVARGNAPLREHLLEQREPFHVHMLKRENGHLIILVSNGPGEAVEKPAPLVIPPS